MMKNEGDMKIFLNTAKWDNQLQLMTFESQTENELQLKH